MSQEDPTLKARLDKLMADVERTSASQPTPHSQAANPQPAKPPKGTLARWKDNALLPLQILAIPWAQELVDQIVFQGRWNLPIHPRTWEGLPGIITAAFSHANFAHLIGNSVAFTIFAWLLLVKSRRDFWTTFLMGWLGGGALSWLLGPTSVHGLSGVVYALFGYLLVIGWLERRFVPLLISVFVLLNYSYTLWGIFPTQPMVAWWGHLIGFLLGMFAAYGVYREPQSR